MSQLEQPDPEERRPLTAATGFGDMRGAVNGSDTNGGDKEDWAGNGINATGTNSSRGHNEEPSLMDPDFAPTRPGTFGTGTATGHVSGSYGSFAGL